MKTNLLEYYEQRAEHYDVMYDIPARQAELGSLARYLSDTLAHQQVLEVACGTGYWTERYAPAAQSVVATDLCVPMLEQARNKVYPLNKVEFERADAFDLPAGKYSAIVAGFWWAHVKRSQQSMFLEHLQKTGGAGTQLILFDNCYVEGNVADGRSTPIARTDAEGNTYQIRRLTDDTRYEVLKNYPTDSALRKKLAAHARDIRIERGRYYWVLSCVLR